MSRKKSRLPALLGNPVWLQNWPVVSRRTRSIRW